jgi:hypothetical protein
MQCLSATLMLSSLTCRANADRITFSDGAALALSSPLTPSEKKNFGSGWKAATYENLKGEKFDLFPMEALTSSGGVLFGDSYPPEVSPTGKYVVIDVLRVGIVTPGPTGKPKVQSRQYCPVLETRTGCIVSNQTGELCGGEWGTQGNRWIVHGMVEDTSTPMLRYQFEDANTIWHGYANARNKPFRISIREVIFSNLGIANLMACDPPKVNNAESYKSIAVELKKAGDVEDSEYIAKKLKSTLVSGGHLELRKIFVKKAFLFDRPSGEFQAEMYLIKGDQVKILEQVGTEWVRVEYLEKSGRIIQKWIRAKSIN